MSKPTPALTAIATLFTVVLLAAAPAVQAAPFAITYTGRMSAPDPYYGSLFPELRAGESYTLSLIFDNGGTTAASQTWTGDDLTCVLFRMNDARSAAFAQDLRARPPGVADGSVTTNAGGALTTVFSNVSTPPLGADPVHYSARGIAFDPRGAVDWYANGDNAVLSDTAASHYLEDTAGGVPMQVARWTAPLPFAGNCDANAVPPQPAPGPGGSQAMAVPALGIPALALLTLGAAGLGARRVQRRSKHQS